MNHFLRDSFAVAPSFSSNVRRFLALLMCGCATAFLPVGATSHAEEAPKAPLQTNVAKKKALTPLAAAFDLDKDGVLSAAEQKAFDDSKAAKREQRHTEELSKYDLNHDGKINKDERAKIQADKEAEKAKLAADKAKTEADAAKAKADEKLKAAKEKAAGKPKLPTTGATNTVVKP